MRVALLCCVAATEALTANSGGATGRFAAGGVSAAISHGYTTPLDVIKTRMQTNPELYKGDVFFALKEIIEAVAAAFCCRASCPPV